jgi:hypothetical protein
MSLLGTRDGRLDHLGRGDLVAADSGRGLDGVPAREGGAVKGSVIDGDVS